MIVSRVLQVAVAMTLGPQSAPSQTPCDDIEVGRPVRSFSVESFSRSMVAARAPFKGEYETTAAWQRRAAESDRTFIATHPFFVVRMPVSTRDLEYDADTNQLRISHSRSWYRSCVDASESNCLLIGTDSDRDTLRAYYIQYRPPVVDFNPYPALNVSPERARAIKESNEHIDLILVVSPQPPFDLISNSFTNLSRQANETHSFPVQLHCTVWHVPE
jgi:hypothetical protein